MAEQHLFRGSVGMLDRHAEVMPRTVGALQELDEVGRQGRAGGSGQRRQLRLGRRRLRRIDEDVPILWKGRIVALLNSSDAVA